MPSQTKLIQAQAQNCSWPLRFHGRFHKHDMARLALHLATTILLFVVGSVVLELRLVGVHAIVATLVLGVELINQAGLLHVLCAVDEVLDVGWQLVLLTKVLPAVVLVTLFSLIIPIISSRSLCLFYIFSRCL